MYKIFQPFLQEKVKSKIQFVQQLEDLLEFFEPKCLLKEHGGSSDYVYAFSIQAELAFFQTHLKGFRAAAEGQPPIWGQQDHQALLQAQQPETVRAQQQQTVSPQQQAGQKYPMETQSGKCGKDASGVLAGGKTQGKVEKFVSHDGHAIEFE